MTLHTGTVTRPRYEIAPYRPSPARREAIYGRIQNELPKSFSLYKVMGIGVMTVCVVYAASLWAIPSGRSGVLRTEPCCTVSALRAPATIAREKKHGL